MNAPLNAGNILDADVTTPEFSAETPIGTILNDEEMILDDRSGMRPAQIVEERLSGMLKGHCVKVSQLRLRSTIAGRSNL